MKKIFKIAFIVIVSCSLFVGILDMIETNKRNKQAEKDGKKIHQPYGPYEKYFKRPLDFFLSSIALIILLPVMIVTAVLVRRRLGSPVFFIQDRPGRDGKIFKLKKFRSMTDERDADGKLLSDEVRLTAFGKNLRSSSLDEIPELMNIIRGDMSVVGPRPLLVEYLGLYNEEQRHRHDVRPGLTGLAQVNGRANLFWKDKFKYDCNYVKKITFLSDLHIIMKSVFVVIKRENIENEELGSYYPFQGNDAED